MYLRNIKSFAVVMVLFVLMMAGLVYAQGSAPVIHNVQIEEVTDNEITITWETDKDADSLINYGLQPDYGIIRIPGANRREHSVTLQNLDPGRTYYFRVVSADEDGNQGISADYRVQTEGIPGVAEEAEPGDPGEPGQLVPVEQPTVEEVTEMIEQITEVRELQEILEVVTEAIEGVTEDLTIVGPPTVEAEPTRAIITWETDRPATSEVVYSPTRTYDGNNFEFSRTSINQVELHQIELVGLEPATRYSFQVASTDDLGITGRSRTFEFETPATLPRIQNLRILKVEEEEATLAWDTTVPAEALVEFQNLSTGEQNSVGRPTLATSHQMNLSDLQFGTRYVAFAIAENSSGDRVRSQPIQFITVRDTEPPIISNVTNESTLFPGSEARIQTIVEWVTDELAYCTMTYQEGVAGGSDQVELVSEIVEYNTSHVKVITEFQPATSYQFWLNCEDEAGNMAQSENFVLFTPIREQNIIDLILENFEQTFGWIQNITN